MEAAFSSIAFAEPARAEANLARLEKHLPGKLWASLPALLGQVPDPDAVLNFLERFLEAAPEGVRRFLGRNPVSLHRLLVVFGYSRFLSETLIAQPELIQWLHRSGPQGSLERAKTQEDLHEEFARFEASGAGERRPAGTVALDLPPSEVLARFKRREYLRIMLRDVLGLATLAETTMELSDLADVLLERALRICEQKQQNAFGQPQATDPKGHRHPVRLSVISLGKLGARELNYNSDVDLMFLFGRDGETSGGSRGAITNAEYFVRLAQALLKAITENTPEGAVFRVDLRLRPQGQEGDLAVSLPAALHYYRRRAREWELQMLIKARCSAGDAETARGFMQELRPMIFPAGGSLDPAAISAVEAVLNAREEITRELRRRAGAEAHAVEWNVKLSPGGIRDIEFLAQCLQRVHGGGDAWLASPAAAGTLVALQRLHDKGYLSGRDFFRLGTAYQFLRRVEHRLQLRDGLQRHTLPEDPAALDRLARRCGLEPSANRPPREQLLHRIRQHFSEVREIYERILKPGQEERVLPGAVEPEVEPGEAALLQRLRADYPEVAHAAEACAAGDAYARRGLQRYLSSAVLEPPCMAHLQRHPALLARASEVFAASDFLADLLCRYPSEIELLESDTGSAGRPSIMADPAGAESALRVNYRRKLVQALVRAVRGESRPFETFAAITAVSEEALQGALRLAAAAGRLLQGDLSSAPFAVIALGRLGTHELDVASDADLVFVADESLSAEAREPWRRLAEQFVHLVSSHTREGLLLPVDTRLRPRGNESDLVHSAAYLAEYCRTEAQAWEALTWLKARPLTGNPALAARAIAAARQILGARFRDPMQLAAELAPMRKRLEEEAAAVRSKNEFKKMAGGNYDIEYALGFLFLTRGVPPVAGHVLRQIAALESAGALDTSSAQGLRTASLLYRSMDHAVRIVTGRSARRLPEPALAARVVPLLERWGIPLAGEASAEPAARISSAVGECQRQVRAIYDSTLSGA